MGERSTFAQDGNVQAQLAKRRLELIKRDFGKTRNTLRLSDVLVNNLMN